MVGTLYDKMYENFVEEVDAVDNGISQWAEGEPRYACLKFLSSIDPPTSPTLNLLAILSLFQVDPSGEIVELAKGGCPWKEHLYHLESGLSPPVAIIFVIYTDQAGQWRVQCVPKEPHSFQSRLPLPEPWRGLRDEALDQVSGIPGCIFVHASGFIGGHRTREGALNMARATLAQRSYLPQMS
uniref:Uncharacterized protein n=1 Tax=Colobus angolensis palliatus TaxID=336983 RepID=A0A2K5H6Q0_COLAP